MRRDELAQAIPPAYTEFLGGNCIRGLAGGGIQTQTALGLASVTQTPLQENAGVFHKSCANSTVTTQTQTAA